MEMLKRQDDFFEKLRSHPDFNQLTGEDLREIIDLLVEPTRRIESCISKGQLKQLAKQLLAQNTAFRKILKDLQK